MFDEKRALHRGRRFLSSRRDRHKNLALLIRGLISQECQFSATKDLGQEAKITDRSRYEIAFEMRFMIPGKISYIIYNAICTESRIIYKIGVDAIF